MGTIQLDDQERELLDSYERDEWQVIHGAQAAPGQYQGYALATLEEAGMVSILLPKEDLGVLRKRAAEVGMSYQSLFANIVHQYASGQLVEKGRGA